MVKQNRNRKTFRGNEFREIEEFFKDVGEAIVSVAEDTVEAFEKVGDALEDAFSGY